MSFKMKDQYWETSGASGLYVRATFRTFQFLFAIIIAILYGIDLTFASSTSTRAQSAWIFAEVAAALSAITCILHCFVTVKRVLWCVWDWLLVVLWAAQTGVFGTIFIKGAAGKVEFLSATTSVPRMKAAVWISLFNMLLWLATTLLGMVWCCTARRVTRKTDKMDVEERDVDSVSLETNGQQDHAEHKKEKEEKEWTMDSEINGKHSRKSMV